MGVSSSNQQPRCRTLEVTPIGVTLTHPKPMSARARIVGRHGIQSNPARSSMDPAVLEGERLTIRQADFLMLRGSEFRVDKQKSSGYIQPIVCAGVF